MSSSVVPSVQLRMTFVAGLPLDGKYETYNCMSEYDVRVKDVNYHIKVTRGADSAAEHNRLLLFKEELELGQADYYDTLHDKTTHIGLMKANDYDDKKEGRVPVGTLLFDAVKRLASINGFSMIELFSGSNEASTFYKAMGMETTEHQGQFIMKVEKARRRRKSRKHRKTRTRSNNNRRN